MKTLQEILDAHREYEALRVRLLDRPAAELLGDNRVLTELLKKFTDMLTIENLKRIHNEYAEVMGFMAAEKEQMLNMMIALPSHAQELHFKQERVRAARIQEWYDEPKS